MIVENVDMCAVAYSQFVKPRSLITSSSSFAYSYMNEEFGIPLALSSNPSSYVSHLDVHSMWSRLANIYANWIVHCRLYLRRHLMEELFRAKFGADFPSMQEISSHAAYTLVNSEPLIDYGCPTLNRVISIGGIGIKEPKALDEKWNEVLSRRSKTVLLSFGSLAKSVHLPVMIKESLMKVVGRFPDVTFIWKYENPDDEFGKNASSSLPNLVLTSWMPQNDLLNDDRLTAFITHGGMGSTQETAVRGKPGVFIPLFGDQPRNAGMMEYNGLGKHVRIVIKNKKQKEKKYFYWILRLRCRYRKNVRRISKMLAEKPFKAKELMIKTVEFAAEFGPSLALRPQSYDMSGIEYHNL
ncbi:hypothetical protein PFISCL1PPCAC_16541, partial [Pristionchus fissidentatus]